MSAFSLRRRQWLTLLKEKGAAMGDDLAHRLGRAGSVVVADEVFDGYGIEKKSCRFGPEGLGIESVQGRRNLL